MSPCTVLSDFQKFSDAIPPNTQDDKVVVTVGYAYIYTLPQLMSRVWLAMNIQAKYDVLKVLWLSLSGLYTLCCKVLPLYHHCQ